MIPKEHASQVKIMHKALDFIYFIPESEKIEKIRNDIMVSMHTGWIDTTTGMEVKKFGERFLEIYTMQKSLFDLLSSNMNRQSKVTVKVTPFGDQHFTIPSQTYQDLLRPLAKLETPFQGQLARCGSLATLDIGEKGLQPLLELIGKITGPNQEAFQLITSMMSQSIANLFHSAILSDPAMISFMTIDGIKFSTTELFVCIEKVSATRIDLFIKTITSIEGVAERDSTGHKRIQKQFPTSKIRIELPVSIVTDNLLRTRLDVWPEQCSFGLYFQ